MAGLFDLHVQILLQDGWATYAADLEEFKALFNDAEVPEGMLEDWHEALFPGGSADAVSFRQAFRPGDDKLPLIVVQQNEEPSNQQPIGYYQGADDEGRTVLGLLQNEIAVITFAVSKPELTRPIHTVIKASMIRGAAWIRSIGYSTLQFLGGGDLQSERDLLPEDFGVYFRSQRWLATSQPHVRLAATPPKSVILAASDVTVDGVAGGVTPTVE